MRYGEDNYENFSDDFSVYGGDQYTPANNFAVMPPASSFAVMPPAAQPAPAAAPVLDEYDDYTGRMGPDGEPERYSTMRGGDPRVKQQQELAERERRLQEPFSIENWLKSANKDVRGTTAASQITLEPGTQYRIRDYSGKNDGQIIASGSTPEEFLMMQDIARGLARQGTNADYRLEQVGGQPAQNFGQYRDPSSGEVVSVIGGDLYNKPIAGDIIKIALPAALALIPGVGAGLSAGLAAKGSVAAKMIGAGLASGIGRTAAGVLTGDPLLDSLKAGAISGLASGATAGLLDKIGVDKALSNAFSSTKGALAGETAGQAAGQVGGQALQRAAEEGLIDVVASRFAPSLLSGGLSAASGSLLGEVGQSLARPVDPFQQAVDQGRLESRFAPDVPAPDADEILALGKRIAPTIPGADVLAAATGSALTAPLSPLDLPAQAKQPAQPPGEEEIVVSNTALPKVDLTGGLSALVPSVLPPTTTSPLDAGTQPGEEPELLAEADRIKRFEAEAAAAAAAGALPAAAASTVEPELLAEAERIKRFEAEAATAAAAGAAAPTGALSAAESTVEPELLAEAERIKRFEAEAATAAAAGALPAAVAGEDPTQTVTGKRTEDVKIGASLAVIPAAALHAATATGGNLDYLNDVLQDEIDTQTVSGKRPIIDKIITGVLGAAGLGAVANTIGASGKPATTADKIQTGLTGAAILAGALGGGGGGGGGGQVGLESLNPIFRAQLPTPRGQFAPQALAQRQPGEGGRPPIDYARYGYGPARSFFNYVPETEAERAAFATAAAPAPRTGVGTVMPQAVPGAAEPTGATDSVLRAGFEQLRAAMPGASDAELIAFLGTPEGQQELADIFERLGAKPRAKGGKMGGSGQSQESFAVNGAGTGRSDEIPALLSDGEYVIDAETVALLGDGSGKAGAKRLDDFRINIRKHKGRNLAKGKFSVNAKRPERYLSGGRV